MERYGTEPSSAAFLQAFLQARAIAAQQAAAREQEDKLLARLRLQQQFKLEDESRAQAGQASALSQMAEGDKTGALARFMGLEKKPAVPAVEGEPERLAFDAEIGKVKPEQAPTFAEFAKTQVGSAVKRGEPYTLSGGQGRYVEGELVAERPWESSGAAPDPNNQWRYDHYIDPRGRSGWRPKPAKLIAHGERLISEGTHPDSPEGKQSMAVAASTIVVSPDKGIFTGSDVAMPRPGVGPAGPGGEPVPRIKSDKPVSSEVTTTLAGSVRAREAGQRINALVDRPEVQDYMGKISQYKANAQRWGTDVKKLGRDLGIEVPMPGAFSTPPPPAYSAAERDLFTLQNYVRRLITGAQSAGWEIPLIGGELPQFGLPPQDFKIRLNQTLQDVSRSEQIITQLALSGNQEAQAFMQNIGIALPKSPAGVSGQGQPGPPKKPIPSVPAPRSPSGSAVPHYKFNPKSGRLEPK